MRWSEDPRIREGLTSLESVVPKACERMEPTISDSMSQREVGQVLVAGLDMILKGKVPKQLNRQGI